jgi:fumarate reductase subunit C
MNQQTTWIITFRSTSAVDASQDAAELQEFLQAALPDIEITRQRSNDYTQNFGDRLIAILNTTGVTALLSKIASFLNLKPRNSTISIEGRAEGEEIIFKAEQIPAKDFRYTLDQFLATYKELKSRKQ